ncbi:MAG: glutamate-1-semialdehyde 2,1-aminomutase [Planctomycetes bacterium]|nr:glutamate-1-semialdehyde 2,1-aminomutase [Planctomycetota bacterium]
MPKASFSMTRSRKAYEDARAVFPGGVNSPVRSWRSVGLIESGPFFVLRGKGPYLIDLDGNRYVDFVGSWGPQILGHCPGPVVAAIKKQAARGASFGCPTDLETRLARKLQKVMPAMEMLRFVSSGSEATSHAIRVARGFTGREKILKFEGCYHGAHDAVLVKAGSGAATFGVPDSAGVPAAVAANTLTVPFNDLDAVRAALNANKQEVAALIVEPVVGNSGTLIPEPGFLEGLGLAAKAAGALLIFDEVMTGFRLAPGGAQEKYGIRPDLVTCGKILGGGLPCGAYGGRKEIMQQVAPLGPVYQAGTLSGNPLAMAAGLATLEILLKKENYKKLEETSAQIEALLWEGAEAAGKKPKLSINRVGSMFTVFFRTGPVRNFADASGSDTAAFGRFFQSLLRNGVYFPPSQYEAAFVNLAMGPKELKIVGKAARAAFAEV